MGNKHFVGFISISILFSSLNFQLDLWLHIDLSHALKSVVAEERNLMPNEVIARGPIGWSLSSHSFGDH